MSDPEVSRVYQYFWRHPALRRATGVVAAAKDLLKVPVVVRMEGTNVELASRFSAIAA
jgi:succinyl-CoA synthetase beta subunit